MDLSTVFDRDTLSFLTTFTGEADFFGAAVACFLIGDLAGDTLFIGESRLLLVGDFAGDLDGDLAGVLVVLAGVFEGVLAGVLDVFATDLGFSALTGSGWREGIPNPRPKTGLIGSIVEGTSAL